jgi:hypothetical protein
VLRLGNREELGWAWLLGRGGKRPAQRVEKEKGCGLGWLFFSFLIFYFFS